MTSDTQYYVLQYYVLQQHHQFLFTRPKERDHKDLNSKNRISNTISNAKMMMMSPRAWATSIHAASSTVKGTTWKKALLQPLSTLQRLQHQHNDNHNDGNKRHLEWCRPCLASQNRSFTHDRRQLLSTSAQMMTQFTWDG